jgi:hypothetical protein
VPGKCSAIRLARRSDPLDNQMGRVNSFGARRPSTKSLTLEGGET